jgi:hypothetical protein
MLRLAMAITTTDSTGEEQQLIESKAMIEEITRDDLTLQRYVLPRNEPSRDLFAA